jgi:aminopeptidase N
MKPALLLVLALFSGQSTDFDVLDYSADLEIDLQGQAVRGAVTMTWMSLVDGLMSIELDAPGLTVEAVAEKARPLSHEVRDGKLRVILDRPSVRDEARALTVRYSGKPARGMRFGAEQVFTAFHTAHWLVSKSDPADKASLTLGLTLPSGLEVVANGKPVARESLPEGRVRHVWREERPYSTYLFGFAAGKFREAERQVGPVRLRFLSPSLTPAELERIFASTGAALEFFQRKAGLPLPVDTYTQVLLPGGPAQEMSGFSVMSDDYGRSVLADPREDYLVAHELAHQWWGNLVTCESWSEFWLNEGMVTFLTAAFKESFWGRDEYDRERAMARLRYQRALDEGGVRPLVHTGWSKPEDMSGPLTYSRGALVLHLLRMEIGERAFWEGLRTYTRAGAGRIGTTADLRVAMELAAGRKLGWFFSQWVYGGPEDLIARHREEPGAVVVEIEQRQAEPWRIPLTVVVETSRERVSRRVELSGRREVLRFATDAPVLAVTIDPGGHLPRAVRHERPAAMLRHQLAHEPEVAGRIDALLELGKLCEAAPAAPACGEARAALEESQASDSSRLVRQLASRTLENSRASNPR